MSGTIDNQGNLDVNGDGIPDEVLYTTESDITTLSVFINNGDGSYRAPQTFAFDYEGAPQILFTTSGTFVYTKETGQGYELAKLNQQGAFESTSTPLADIGSPLPPPVALPTSPIDPVKTTSIIGYNGLPPTDEYSSYFEEELTISPPDLAAKLLPNTVLLSDTIFYGQEAVPTDTVVAEAHAGSTYDLVIQHSLFDGAEVTLSLLPGTLEPATGGGVPCYCRGTRILAASGEVAVEDLQVGDLVVSLLADGDGLRPVRWLGHRRIAPWRHPVAADVMPIRVRAGALGEAKPHRDLLLSPGHRLMLEDTLVRAIELVNGSTITPDNPDWVEYWHVELEEHGVLVAEGVAAESYLDTGNRVAFENGAVTHLHPVLDAEAPQPCLPYKLPSFAVREQIVRRAEVLGWVRSSSAEPWLEVDGRRIEPAQRGSRYRFELPGGCGEVRLCSRAARPCDVDPRATDWRRLGIALTRLTLSGSLGAWDVPLHDERLSDGFSHLETDLAGWTWRWTDGSARIPIAELSKGQQLATLEVALDETNLLYWVRPAEVDVLSRAA